MTRSKVAKRDFQVGAAAASYTASDLYESQDDNSDGATVEYVPTGKEFESKTPKGAVMDDRKPGIIVH